jgi:hypothetical protein
MIKRKTLSLVRLHFQRIFALPVTRTTFREVQNVIFAAADGNADLASSFLEILFLGEYKDGVVTEKARETLELLIEDYSLPIRLAREVQDRGDIVSLILSDPIEQKDSIGFLHRLKKVDGTEFHFVTDPVATLNLFNHMAMRLEEMDNSNKAEEDFRRFNPLLVAVKTLMDNLIKKYPPLPQEKETDSTDE